MLKENPPTQKYIENALNCSVTTVYKTVKYDLNFKKAIK